MAALSKSSPPPTPAHASCNSPACLDAPAQLALQRRASAREPPPAACPLSQCTERIASALAAVQQLAPARRLAACCPPPICTCCCRRPRTRARARAAAGAPPAAAACSRAGGGAAASKRAPPGRAGGTRVRHELQDLFSLIPPQSAWRLFGRASRSPVCNDAALQYRILPPKASARYCWKTSSVSARVPAALRDRPGQSRSVSRVQRRGSGIKHGWRALGTNEELCSPAQDMGQPGTVASAQHWQFPLNNDIAPNSFDCT
ncbi:hypothetical protein FGB62_169g16 [Gracilaria domingensis]|nr:hypothetical protein FGB62_169g16 [Gracilaria domingensis]